MFFGKAACSSCHEVNGRGGITGPDLSNAARFSPAALRQKIVDPNKAISDQYAATVFALTDGRIVTAAA